MYLASPGLGCKQAGSSVVVCELLVAACGIQFPDQGSNPGLCIENAESATGPLEKSLNKVFRFIIQPTLTSDLEAASPWTKNRGYRDE